MKGLMTVVRRALLIRMKADAGILALVAKTSIHRQSAGDPEWPFIKLGPPTTTPRRAAELDGGQVMISVHAFARGRYAGEDEVENAEDHAGRIGAAIEVALDAKGETVTVDGKTARLRYLLADRQLFVDSGEEDAFHWFANVVAKVTAA